MSSRIIYDKERIGEFAKPARIPGTSWVNFEAIGYEIDGELIAGVVYTDYQGCNISMHLCAKGRWLTKEYIQAVFHYPFKQLGVNRVTAYVAGKRDDLQQFYKLFGFEQEGVLRQALKDDDLIIMGLLRKDYEDLH